jgi:chromosome segregation ATPase
VPRMGSFRRSLFGYRRLDVEETIAAREAEILGLQARLSDREGRLAGLENETTSLSGMVVEREREIRVLGERLREANECHDRSIASLDAVTQRLEEMQAQARGQATRIRMKALREAVEVSRKVQALTDAQEPVEQPPADAPAAANGNSAPADGLYEGDVRLEIGPLGDFAQLVGFEDAVGRLGASQISIERFSEGRATLSMRLDQPTELLRELEELSSLDFKVRHTAPGNLVLDLDDEQDPGQQAA